MPGGAIRAHGIVVPANRPRMAGQAARRAWIV
jgi:hypothetical protein